MSSRPSSTRIVSGWPSWLQTGPRVRTTSSRPKGAPGSIAGHSRERVSTPVRIRSFAFARGFGRLLRS